MPVSPGASGTQPRDPCRPWRGTVASGHKPRGGLLALQSLESNPQLSFATRMEDWTCLGQHKRQPEFPVVIRESRRNSRKTTWLPRHRKMKPFPATAPQEKFHVRNWKSKGTWHSSCDPQSSPKSRSPSRGTLRFSGTPSSEPFLPSGSGQEGRLPCFVWKGFPTFRSHLRMRPVSRRHSRRGLVGGSTFRRTPISRSPLDKNPMPGHLFELHPVNAVNTKGQFFRASFGKNPRFQIQRDKRPLSPGTSREASGVPCLNPRRGLTLLSPVCREPAIGV